MSRERWNVLLARTPVRLVLAGVLVLTAFVGVRAADGLIGTTDGSQPTAATSPGADASPAAASASATSTQPAASPTAAAASEPSFNLSGGGAKNLVVLTNRNDDGFTGRGQLQLNLIPGPRVAPVNLARAVASCTDCQTLAVALQINVYERGAPQVTPQNAAVAVNISCQDCLTVARSIQYVIPVDDVRDVPPDVRELAREMDRELHELTRDRSLSLAEREARLDAVIGRFRDLAAYLRQERDVTDAGDSPDKSFPAEPTGSPEASPTAEPSAAPSGSPEAGTSDSSTGATSPSGVSPPP